MTPKETPTTMQAPPPRPPARRPSRFVWHRFLRGPEQDTTWARPALLGLLAATALLYVWGLGASGWANSFYSAAAQAGSVSWEAFFYGSSDAANSITVDKTPASLWVMALSARLFGVSSWSILVPQALIGVGTVALLHATVRLWFGHGAALLAGAVLALTPVAVLMFRFNNPDALLVLLLVAAAYACTRAVETADTRWVALIGVFVGLGFLTKMLQALLVVPMFAVVYLVAAPTPVRRRIVQLVVGGLAMVATAGWWVAVVKLVPASARPYVGGSQANSVLELVIGYNGVGRLTGEETGSVGGQGGWGETGILRMFDAEIAGQIAWLLPASLILLVAGLWATRRAPRTDRTRAALLLWGGWLLLTGAVFSLMQGIFHAYYTVALAPAVAALVGIGVTALWKAREHVAARAVLAGTLAVTAVWSFVLLRRSTDFMPWLPPLVLLTGLALAGALAAHASSVRGRALTALAAAGVVVALAGPAAYAVQTASTPHTGAIPTAGPQVVGGQGSPGGRPPAVPGGGFPGGRFPGAGFPGGGGPGAGPQGGPRFGVMGGCSTGPPPARRWSRCSSRTPTPTRGSQPLSARTTLPATSSRRGPR
jgi:4-amino-4-deoxy-L-arabinose transferase-like glycosyltransferase